MPTQLYLRPHRPSLPCSPSLPSLRRESKTKSVNELVEEMEEVANQEHTSLMEDDIENEGEISQQQTDDMEDGMPAVVSDTTADKQCGPLNVRRRIWHYILRTWTGVLAKKTKEPILEDLELPHRYRPENLNALCDATGFSVSEMKRIYRSFKTECPSGLITEEAFHSIYSRFFPQGAGVSSYAHFVFSTLDHKDTGIITFRDFVVGLSTLVRGSIEERLKWAFSLYDQDRDGLICREELEDVVGSVFDLMGRTGDPVEEERLISDRVDFMIEKLDLNGDGVISLDEFLEVCQNDELIRTSVNAFTSVRT